MKTIGITGGKGGTGKSTIAAALAVELAKKSRVMLVDMDADCPNDHLILGIERKFLKTVFQRVPKFDIQRCTKCGLCAKVCLANAIVSIKGKNPVFMSAQCNGCGACVIRCPSKAISWSRKEAGYIYSGSGHNTELLSGELKINEPVSERIVDELKDMLVKEKDNYDFIIVDTAAGTKCDVISALERCDIVLAVTEPTPLGEHDLSLILELLDMLKIPKHVILNRSDIGRRELIEKVSKRFRAKIVLEIPYSKKILQSYSKGEPVRIKQIKKVIDEII